MSDRINQIAKGFWNIRGDFKIGGVINIGTHASLVRRSNGKFLMLDAYTLAGDEKSQIDALTDNGRNVDAVINLHPFHTVHVARGFKQFPNAKWYGTQRHVKKFPDLPWQAELTESKECAALFADDLEFSVPAGVDFISKNENLHFSSVLAYHKASKTIHVDDTLMYMKLPGPLGKAVKPQVTFHMTLPMTLERRAGAVSEFRDWVTQIAQQWRDAENLCAAHSAALIGRKNRSDSISNRIVAALNKVERPLKRHEKKYG